MNPPPGVWPVAVWCTYAWSAVGAAHLTVDTRYGQPCVVYYTPPATIHGAGTLSYQPEGGHEAPSPSKKLAHIGISFAVQIVIYIVGFLLIMLFFAVAINNVMGQY